MLTTREKQSLDSHIMGKYFDEESYEIYGEKVEIFYTDYFIKKLNENCDLQDEVFNIEDYMLEKEKSPELAANIIERYIKLKYGYE